VGEGMFKILVKLDTDTLFLADTEILNKKDSDYWGVWEF
jgi:hypothetical protein